MMFSRAHTALGSFSMGCLLSNTHSLLVLLPWLVFSSSQDNIRDITDSLIGECLEKKAVTNLAAQVPEEKIINLVNDLFGAGTFPHWLLHYCRFSQAPCVIALSEPPLSNTRQPVRV